MRRSLFHRMDVTIFFIIVQLLWYSFPSSSTGIACRAAPYRTGCPYACRRKTASRLSKKESTDFKNSKNEWHFVMLPARITKQPLVQIKTHKTFPNDQQCYVTTGDPFLFLYPKTPPNVMTNVPPRLFGCAEDLDALRWGFLPVPRRFL